jgi:hypothetical protein
LDIVATPEQIRSGTARAIADHLLAYMDDHYPGLFATYVGITDDPHRLPVRGLTTERLAQDDLDDERLFVLGGERIAPTPAEQTSLIMPDQNVVYWGDPNRAFIEVIGLPAETLRLSPDELDRRRQRGPLRAAFIPDPVASVADVLLNQPMIWRTAADFSAATTATLSKAEAQAFARQMRLHANWSTFIGVDQRETPTAGFLIELRVAYPQTSSLLTALQSIEEVEAAKGNQLPADLLGAIYAALMGLLDSPRRSVALPHLAAMTLGRLCWHYAHDCYFPESLPAPLNQQRLTWMGSALCDGLGMTSDDPELFEPELRPTDVARVLLDAGRRLWQTDTLRYVVQSFQDENLVVDRSTLADFNDLARVWLLVQPVGLRVDIAGLRLACDDPLEFFYAYLQVLELVAAGLWPGALQGLLSDGRLPQVSGSGLTQYPADDEDDALDDLDVAKAAAPAMPADRVALADDLRRLGDEPASYAPAGVFQLRLPPDLAGQWLTGVETLLIYADTDGLWFRLSGDVSGLVGWTPSSPVRDWVLDSRIAIELELLARALWVDLRQAGVQVLPRVDGQNDLPQATGEIRLSGERQWLPQAGTIQARGLSRLLAGWNNHPSIKA